MMETSIGNSSIYTSKKDGLQKKPLSKKNIYLRREYP